MSSTKNINGLDEMVGALCRAGLVFDRSSDDRSYKAVHDAFCAYRDYADALIAQETAAKDARIAELEAANQQQRALLDSINDIHDRRARVLLAQVETLRAQVAELKAALAAQGAGEPVAWCALTKSGHIQYFDGKPMVMVGGLTNDLHPVPLYTRPPAAEQAEALKAEYTRGYDAGRLDELEENREALKDAADMFWDYDDGERFGHSIEEIVADYGPGEIVKIDQAKRLPTISVRAVMDGEDMSYEVLDDAAIAAAQGAKGGV